MNSSDTPGFVSRSALKALSGTLLSRLTGLFRDMAMAFYFGASASLAAFLLAYRFIYLARRLFGESLLHQGFIPRFEQYRAVDPQKAARFFRDLFWTLLLVLFGVVLIGEGILSQVKGDVALTSRWMFPGIISLCLFGLTSGLLNTEKSFFLPSVSPATFNLVWILGVIVLSHQTTRGAVMGLSILIPLAFFFQLAMTLPKTFQYLRSHMELRQVFAVRPFSVELKGLHKPLLLGVVGVAAVQVNSAIDGVFARFAAAEGPAYLWYAIRMQQLPLALFGLALSSALLPSLSRSFEKGDMQGFQALLDSAAKKILLLMLPCTIGIFALGASSVNLLFGRGGFDAIATKETTLCLWGYGIGLIPMALAQILAPAFYAKKDYKTPSMGFVYSSILNISLNAILVFVFHMSAASIALATSGAAIFNVIYLRRKLTLKRLVSTKYILIVGVSGLMTLALGYFGLQDPTLPIVLGHPEFARTTLLQFGQFSIQAITFFGLIALQLKLLFRSYWEEILAVVISR